MVWGEGRATRRGKVDWPGRECEGKRGEKERGAGSAGLGGPSGGGQGCAGDKGNHACFFVYESSRPQRPLKHRFLETGWCF